MSLVTLGRADFRGSALACIIMQFPDMSSRAQPALTGQKQLIIRIIVLQKIFPTANGSDPNPVGVQSIFS